MKIRTASLVLLVGVIVGGGLCLALWRNGGVLRAENEQLLARVAELEAALAKSNAIEKGSATVTAELQSQKRELMRLRDEVTQLRNSRDAAARAEAELARIRADRSNSRTVSTSASSDLGQSLPRDAWTFAGYETPQAAFLSGMWAMKEGQVETMLNSFTPEERERFQGQTQGKTDAEIAQRFQKEYGRVSGVRVVGQTEIAPGEVVLDVYLEGVGALKKYRMNQVGNEWKAGGPINQNANVAAAQNAGNDQTAYDPLAFYRRNPELMKRYFPHLFQAQQQQQAGQQPQPVEAPPNFDPRRDAQVPAR
jgi:hypothetical protein